MAIALGRLPNADDTMVDRLVTTTHPEADQSAVHGLPVEILQAQADSIGLPLQIVPLPGAGLEGYTETMAGLAVQLRAEGIDSFAFGDLSCSGFSTSNGTRSVRGGCPRDAISLIEC